MADRSETPTAAPYVAPEPDGRGPAPGVEPEKLDAGKAYYFVAEDFICGGYRHTPGQVIECDVFRKYAPKKSDTTRRDRGFLILMHGDEYDQTLADWRRKYEPATRAAASA